MPVRQGIQHGPGPVPVGQVPAGARIQQVSGALLPGLRDAHVHLGLIDPLQLAAGGIAAADDLGGVPADLTRLQDLSLSPGSLLPRIRFAGAFLTCPSGYPSGRSWAAAGSWREIRSVRDAETAVAEQVAAGASMIKVALNSTTGPVLAASELAAVVEAAHESGRIVIAHAEGPGMPEAAVDAGADQLAHTPWTHHLAPAVLRTAAEQQSGWISTLALHDGPGREIAISNLRGMLDHGGRVLYGTDQGNGPQPVGVNPAELRALQETGLSGDEILTAMATAGPGESSWQAWPACHVRLPAGSPGPGEEAFARSLSRARVIPAQEGRQ